MIVTGMEANKDSVTFFVFDKIKQNVNNNKSPQYYGVAVILLGNQSSWEICLSMRQINLRERVEIA